MVGSIITAAILLGHMLVPDAGGLGLVLDTGLPWVGLAILLLAVLSLFSRRGRPFIAVVVPAVVWLVMFTPAMLPLGWFAPSPAEATLSIASQNVGAESGTAAESAEALAATDADVVAVQEMDGRTREKINDVLDSHYAYSYTIATVGLWSRYPIENAQPLSLGLSWNRALAADLETPHGTVSVYVIHADSARPGDHAVRDTMLAALADTIPRDENDRVIAIGDFNAASTDRSFEQLTRQLSEPSFSGGMFGFTWPAHFPLTRLDHILQRGMEATSNTVFPAGNSDHLAILATLNL